MVHPDSKSATTEKTANRVMTDRKEVGFIPF
jgi:hypothetical protein